MSSVARVRCVRALFRTKTNVAYTLLKKIRTTLGTTNSTVANSISPAHVVYQYAVQQKLKLVTGPPEKQTVTDGSGTRRTYVVSRLFLQDEEQQTKFSCSGKSVSTGTLEHGTHPHHRHWLCGPPEKPPSKPFALALALALTLALKLARRPFTQRERRSRSRRRTCSRSS